MRWSLVAALIGMLSACTLQGGPDAPKTGAPNTAMTETGVTETGAPQPDPPETGATEATATPAAAPPPPAADPAPPPSPEAAACLRLGGIWATNGGSLMHACLRRTRDAGKTCTSERDCEGQCLARSRSCAPITPLFGCNPVLQADGTEAVLCLN